MENRRYPSISRSVSFSLFTEPPAVMGIVNCTPDSFYPGSRNRSVAAAYETARRMIAGGADILDIGGESTRPGSDYVDEEKERSRVIPVIEEIRNFSTIPISVDTRKADVAAAALEAGADMINDISALEDDPELVSLLAEKGVPVILMHKQGTPKNMQDDPRYEDPVADIIDYFAFRIEFAEAKGISKDRIMIDPGIGFGKRLQDNLQILRRIDEFHALGVPICLGVSRKSFIGKLLGEDDRTEGVDERLYGTLGVNAWAAFKDVQILRVHDVAEHAEMLTMIKALRRVKKGT
jgi:dihydropteroate synthase